MRLQRALKYSTGCPNLIRIKRAKLLPEHVVAFSGSILRIMEGVMQKASRTVAHDANSGAQDFVAWSAVAMWGLAAVYLLVTFQPF